MTAHFIRKHSFMDTLYKELEIESTKQCHNSINLNVIFYVSRHSVKILLLTLPVHVLQVLIHHLHETDNHLMTQDTSKVSHCAPQLYAFGTS